MRRVIRVVPVVLFVFATLGQSGIAQAQTPKSDPTVRDILLKQWTDIGEKADGTLNELPKAQYATKAAVVKALKDSFFDATLPLKRRGGAQREAHRPLGGVHRAFGRALRSAGRLLPAQRHRTAGIAGAVARGCRAALSGPPTRA